MTLSDEVAFGLNPNPGSNPCGSLTPTIPPAGSCTIEVSFSPSTVHHSEALSIESDSAVDSTKVISLTGAGFNDCSAFEDDLQLTDDRVDNTAITHHGCISITAGPYTVGPAGDVTFMAGSDIVVRNGFRVDGTFRAVLNPLLLPPL
jgi:hypothetical protein